MTCMMLTSKINLEHYFSVTVYFKSTQFSSCPELDCVTESKVPSLKFLIPDPQVSSDCPFGLFMIFKIYLQKYYITHYTNVH